MPLLAATRVSSPAHSPCLRRLVGRSLVRCGRYHLVSGFRASQTWACDMALPSSAEPKLLRPCAALPGYRRLHVSRSGLLRKGWQEGDLCWNTLQRAVSNATFGFVLTWVVREKTEKAFRVRKKALTDLANLYQGRSDAAILIFSHGESCTAVHPDLLKWVAKGRGACIDGPNLGARQVATVPRFAEEFYNSLPRTIIFLPDDPIVALLEKPGKVENIPVGSSAWVRKLEATFSARQDAAAVAKAGGSGVFANGSAVWEVTACRPFRPSASPSSPRPLITPRPPRVSSSARVPA